MKRFKIILIVLTVLLMGTTAIAAPNRGLISYATGAAALSHTFTPTNQVYITNIRLHLSAAATQETFSVYINSAKGSAYDTVLYSKDLTDLTDVSWIPAGKLLVNANDVITLTWTNTDTRTWGTEIGYEY